MHIELRALANFQAVARLGSVSAAAIDRSISQPAISRQITTMEKKLGIRLFRRTPTGMELTAAGEKLYGYASDILSRVDRAEGLMHTLFARQPTYKVACLETTSQFIVIPFMAETAASIADVQTVQPKDVYATLDRGIDLVVSTFPPPANRASLALAEIPITMQFAQDLAWVQGLTAVDLPTLALHRIVMPGFGSAVETTVRNAAAHEGLVLDLSRITSTGSVAQALATSGTTCAVVTEPPQFGLSSLPITSENTTLTITMHAAWDEKHYTVNEIEDIAQSLKLWLRDRTPWASR